MSKRKHSGTGLMLTGIILLVCAAVLAYLNFQRENDAGNTALFIIDSINESISEEKTVQGTDRPIAEELTPAQQQEMSTFDVEGKQYIGVLQIPSLGIELPILRDFSMDALQTAPCLYYGSYYTDDMVIAAHNYSTHFGGISQLSVGDEVTFFGADGQLYSYSVAEMEILEPAEVDHMIDGEWPLTLFTCTWGGTSRVTVRCEKSS